MIIYHPMSTPSPAKRQTSMQMQMHSVDFMSVYSPPETPIPAELVLLVQSLQDAPTTAARISMWIGRDSLLARVVRHIMEGWSKTETVLDTEVGVVNTQRLWLWSDSSTWQRTHAN